MKLFLALQILLSASSYGPFVSAAKSIEEAVGSGCENDIELSSTFSTDSGEECNSCKLCDGYNINEIFMPKGQGICVECVSVDSSCKMLNVITSFSSPWSMKFLPYTATSMSSEYDPKSVFIYGSNDSVTWMELFKSDNTDTLLKERNGTVEFIIGDNDKDYNFYKVTFALKDGVTKMHLGHLGVVPALTKTCAADIFSAITGGHVKLFDTLAPTQAPSDTPSNAPSDTQGHEFNSNEELKIAADLWLTNEESASSQYGDIKDWDVSKITSMNELFGEPDAQDCLKFNGDLSEWDVSAVTEMKNMFRECKVFNGDLSEWNVAALKSARCMFFNAQAFNSNISDWNTSNFTDMGAMFYYAQAFNSNISDWNTSYVTDMYAVFREARAFNSNISDWNTSYVTSMGKMFNEARAFNSNISDWDTSDVTRMDHMFKNAEAFDQVLCWDTSKANKLEMFLNSPGSLSPKYPNC